MPNYRFSAGSAYDFSLAVLFPDFTDSDGDIHATALMAVLRNPRMRMGLPMKMAALKWTTTLMAWKIPRPVSRLAENLDGFEDADGCPDPDNDNDSVLDDVDGCSSAPEDLDGFEDTDGCPDPDNDLDGILDAVDKCPSEVEAFTASKTRMAAQSSIMTEMALPITKTPVRMMRPISALRPDKVR